MRLPYRHHAPHERPVVRWPQGERIAVWVIPNVEYFHFDVPIPGVSDQVPNVPAFATRDYGGRVGFWRIAEVCEEFGVTPSITLNSDVCAGYPDVIEKIATSGWEILGHNRSNSHQLGNVSQAEEEDIIFGSLSTIEEATGQRPRGWLGSGLHEGPTTVATLAAAGIEYVCDWVNDDRPYLFDAEGAPPLISVPYSLQINDKPVIERQGHSSVEFADRAIRQFDVLYREGVESGTVMAIAIHPFLIGQPHRIHAMYDILDHITSHAGVWLTTGGEIADHYRELIGAPRPDRAAPAPTVAPD